MLIEKQYLYHVRCKGENINPIAFGKEIELYRDTERYNAIKQNKISKYVKKWKNENINSRYNEGGNTR